MDLNRLVVGRMGAAQRLASPAHAPVRSAATDAAAAGPDAAHLLVDVEGKVLHPGGPLAHVDGGVVLANEAEDDGR